MHEEGFENKKEDSDEEVDNNFIGTSDKNDLSWLYYDSDRNLESDDDEKFICMGGGGRGKMSKETQNSSSIIGKIH